MATRTVQERSIPDTGPGRAARTTRILDRLRSTGSVLVGDLAADLSTSEMTIRRDLKVLEAEGLVRRIHGGALLVPSRAYEPTFREKSRQFVDEKRRIGKAAAALVEPGDTLILGPGTTTIEVIVTGGRLRGTTYALVGSLADENLRGLHVDKLFIGGNGLTVANGLTTP